jgi:cytochrome bd-type quinol oxidase subunit 1
MLENSSDAVTLRLAAGVLGLAALAAYHLTRRRSRDLLPESFTPTVAMTLFGVAGLVLAGLSVDSTVLGLRSGLGTAAGAGFYLSGAIVALVMALRYARDLHRSILQQARG